MLNVIKTHTNMTTLDLNAYGVTEMSHAEKVDSNGGGLLIGLGLAALAGVLLSSCSVTVTVSNGAANVNTSVSADSTGNGNTAGNGNN